MLIQRLSKLSRIKEKKLISISETASDRYKVYAIPKRTGGTRVIAHPSQELKAIQRWIVNVILSRFPIHQSATAYRKGSGIKENAEIHRSSKYTTRFDFANYFPSFEQSQIQEFLALELPKIGINFDISDINFLGNIICRTGRLSIGAPSSPAITNAMMFTFDQAMFEFCNGRNLAYSRYADDMFISSNEPNQLDGIENQIQRIKQDITYINLRLNRKKTTYLSKKYARKITGIVITPDHKLSIGRHRKREIKSLIHLWLNERLDIERTYYMRGLLAFARDIEPEFEVRLRLKYTDQAINQILRHPNLKATPDEDYNLFFDN